MHTLTPAVDVIKGVLLETLYEAILYSPCYFEEGECGLRQESTSVIVNCTLHNQFDQFMLMNTFNSCNFESKTHGIKVHRDEMDTFVVWLDDTRDQLEQVQQVIIFTNVS